MASCSLDILALGVGPSNLALAVALDEDHEHLARGTVLVEQHTDVKWHRNMLMPWTQSQVAFLKDLVTLRNPRSRFSFLNYLHTQNRLNEFINLGTLTPYRAEISAYLEWVANSLRSVRVEYGRRCIAVKALRDTTGMITGWLTHFADGSAISCQDLVVGVGREPHIPTVFKSIPDDRVIHSSRYIEGIRNFSRAAQLRVAVIGAAQSAAEIFRAVHDDLPNCRPSIIMRSIGLVGYESSKFTNELFYPSYTDIFYHAQPEAREKILAQMHRTNYAGVSPSLIEELYRLRYLQHLSGHTRSQFITATEILDASWMGQEIVLTMRNWVTGQLTKFACDLVLLGTGYEQSMPSLLIGLATDLQIAELAVTRNYRLELGQPAIASVYIQGVNESTHGIADSLLSVLALRSSEIVNDLLHRRGSHSTVNNKES